MATYYVGKGGNDANDGLSWANRKLSLNGAEDIPVAAADIVYVGPGSYRENLTTDVSGTAGNPITYIADVTGENTDDVGGLVRVTGSDNDQTATRTNVITATGGQDYRTFRGFVFDTSSGDTLTANGCTNWIIENCYFDACNGSASNRYIFWGTTACTDWTIRRCVFMPVYNIAILNGTGSDNTTNTLIENCFFNGLVAGGIRPDRCTSLTIKNCTFLGCGYALRYFTNPASGGTTINNCIFQGCNVALQAASSGPITEDYNTFYGNFSNRINASTGSNSQTYPALFSSMLMLSGYKFPWGFPSLSPDSQVATIAGSSESSDDIYGITRPTTSAKKSWGVAQFTNIARETTTTRTGSVSIKMADAGKHQMFVPVANESTTFSIYVNRETNYAGTNPQLVIKQPGVADDTTTDASAASQWNELTTTLTPSTNTDFVVVELVSNNTATSGSYAIYFDDLTVS